MMGARGYDVGRSHVTDPQTAAPIAVVVAEHLPLLLRGIASLFEEQGDIRLAAAVSTSEQAIDAIRAHKPGVTVLGLHMPGKGAFNIMEALAAEGCQTHVVILAISLSDEELLRARHHGVRGIVLLDMPAWTLARCIRIVHAGGEFLWGVPQVGPPANVLWQSAAHDQTGWPLTARENAVVAQVKSGLSNKQIARVLGLTEGTVKSHLHRVYYKLHVHGRYALIKSGEGEIHPPQSVHVL